MAKIILTRIDATLALAAVLFNILMEMLRGHRDAAEKQLELKAKVDTVERAAVAIPLAAEAHDRAKEHEKTTRLRMRDASFGAVAFFEALRPQLKASLPILSKFDVGTCYMLIDEMVRLTEHDPEMKPVALALNRVKDDHLAAVANLERAAGEVTESKVFYNVSASDLEKCVKDVRTFVNANAPKDASYLKLLKRGSGRSSARKPEDKKPEEKKLEVVPPVPAKPEEKKDGVLA